MTDLQIASKARNLTAALAAAGVLLVPALALAWSQKASFETRIHGHEFSKVTLESSGECSLSVRVFFTAPEEGYKTESPARAFYRFHVRIKLDGAHAAVTRVFNNSAPGARAYSYVLDTKSDGCWAKDERKVQGIDVEGCRGAGCTPEPFK